MKVQIRIAIKHFVAAMVYLLIATTAYSTCIPVESGKISLNGEWMLDVVSPEKEAGYKEFYKFEFLDSGMGIINVPLNWELAGFEEARYIMPSDYAGFYRKNIEVPKVSKGERLILHFEGVLYGSKVWFNEEYLGYHKGGFTGFEYDVTEFIRPGGKNLIAVKVMKSRVMGMDFDNHDSWSLSGIYRDVYLYKVPSIHYSDLKVETDLDSKYIDSKLNIDAYLENKSQEKSKIKITVELLSPEGESVLAAGKSADIESGKKIKVAFSENVKNPLKWTAETPNLYTLVMKLSSGDKVLSTISKSIGFREIEVSGVKLLVNGVPVKLKGVDRHETVIERGKALITEDWLRDLEMMKKGNINAIRCSHYPPDPEFLYHTDRMGFYVIDEVCFGHGDHLLSLPDHHKLLKTRVIETLTRDWNHPSVIIWSLGNENPWTTAHPKLISLTHKMDSTRPLLLPRTGVEGGKMGEDLSMDVDIVAPHYPTPERLRSLSEYQESLDQGRPIIMTEYLHSLGRHFFTKEIWDVVWEKESAAGGCVWLWADQGIRRPVNGNQVYKIGDYIEKTEPYTYIANRWLDDNNIVDTHGIYGADGIVNDDRSPQPDFYEVKKIYTPVYIKSESLEFTPGQQSLEISIQNRYDFTNLEGMKLGWELYEDYDVIASGSTEYSNLGPHEFGSQIVPVVMPESVEQDASYILKLSSYDSDGIQVCAHQIELEPVLPVEVKATFGADFFAGSGYPDAVVTVKDLSGKGTGYSADITVYMGEVKLYENTFRGGLGRDEEKKIIIDNWENGFPVELPFRKIEIAADVKTGMLHTVAGGEYFNAEKLSVDKESGNIEIGNSYFKVIFNSTTGKIEAVYKKGDEIKIIGPSLNTWRNKRIVEMSQRIFNRNEFLDSLKAMKEELTRFGVVSIEPEVVVLKAETLSDFGSGNFKTVYTYEVRCDGNVDISFLITPKTQMQALLELGVRFDLPAEFNRFSLTGMGPDTYPGSIENTEVSFMEKMDFRSDEHDFTTNKTKVKKARISSNEKSVGFDFSGDVKNVMNMRAQNGEKTSVFINPWVKHPYKKNRDPAPEYMVYVVSGDKFKGAFTLEIIGD
ncbi:MAG TPA: glycoside hydrolase family 2 TIM barrel-domain containing protein [bacterium]|nr:glycoside hydrolase family 2 TIM barrel-domain containing protein [bacterium]